MLCALQSAGVEASAFDQILGVSAGALNGAYYVAGEMGMGLPVYYEDLSDLRLFDPTRVLSAKSPIDLDLLITQTLEVNRPLTVENVTAADNFSAIATNLATCQSTPLTGLSTKSDLIDALRSSSRLPLLGGRAVEFRGTKYVDGSYSGGLPVELAVAAGATHVLVLFTQPASSALANQASFRVKNSYLDLYRAGLAGSYWRSKQRTHSLRNELSEPSGGPVHIAAISPSDDQPRLSKLETDGEVMRSASLHGWLQAHRFLNPLHDIDESHLSVQYSPNFEVRIESKV